LIRITPEEAEAHGLLPFTLTVELAGLPLLEWRFPRPNVYLQLSGPPGGPLGLSIEQAPLSEANDIPAFIEKRWAGQTGVYLGARDSAHPWEAEYVLGESLARAHHSLSFYPSPKPSLHWVLVDCWIGAADLNPAPFRARLKGTPLEALPDLAQVLYT